MALFNLARMTVTSTGTGTITLNAAVSGFLTFDAAGCSTASAGQSLTYAIGDTTQSEIATGTYRSSSLTLTRGSSTGGMKSTNSNSPINMTNAAQVIITPAAKDFPLVTNDVGTTATSTVAITFGSTLTFTDATASTSVTTGSLVATGGVGVGGSVFADKFSATNQPCFSVHKNGTGQLDIANSTPVKVTFGTELFDIGAFFDTGNSRWTPPAGVVSFTGAAHLLQADTGTIYTLSIFKNGAALKDATRYANGQSTIPNTIAVIDRANGTDFYELFVTVTSGTTTDISGTATQTWFMGLVL